MTESRRRYSRQRGTGAKRLVVISLLSTHPKPNRSIWIFRKRGLFAPAFAGGKFIGLNFLAACFWQRKLWNGGALIGVNFWAEPLATDVKCITSPRGRKWQIITI